MLIAAPASPCRLSCGAAEFVHSGERIGAPVVLFDRDLLIRNLLCSRSAPFVSLRSGSGDAAQAALSSALRGTPAVGLGGRCKNRTPVGGGEGNRRAPRTGIHPQAVVSGRRSGAARSAAADHGLLPAQPAHQRRNPGLEPGLHPSAERRRLRRERGARLLLQPLLRRACRPHSAGAGRGHPRTLRPGADAHPQSREQKELLVLGVAGIAVSPAQMAIAYRKLALELDQAQAPAVREGLKDSVSYGMAHNAAVPGMEIAGKTGTASDAAKPEPWMVCRHRLPGPRRSRDRDLSSARQWSRCRPAGAPLLSRRESDRRRRALARLPSSSSLHDR